MIIDTNKRVHLYNGKTDLQSVESKSPIARAKTHWDYRSDAYLYFASRDRLWDYT